MMDEHPATPGKPCPGGGTCCNRPEFDRAMFPCDIVRQLTALVAAERERCAVIAETWGGAPPNPNGRRAALAAFIRSGRPANEKPASGK